jgi:hypothetical protein
MGGRADLNLISGDRVAGIDCRCCDWRRAGYMSGCAVSSGGAMIGDEAIDERDKLLAGFGQNK